LILDIRGRDFYSAEGATALGNSQAKGPQISSNSGK